MNPLEKIFTFDLSLGGAASTKQNKTNICVYLI
jgi:hypothetical protein